MKTIRYNVFETNSSSEHVFTVTNEKRDKNEFPLPDENGNLSILLTDYYDYTIEPKSSVTDWLKYMATHVFFSYIDKSDLEKIENIQNIYGNDVALNDIEENKALMLKFVQEIYSEFELPEVKNIIFKTLDRNDNEIILNDIEYDRQPWEQKFSTIITSNSKDKYKYLIGVSANDLTTHSLKTAFSNCTWIEELGINSYKGLNKEFYDLKHSNDNNSLEYLKYVFRFKSDLDFIHS
ncbi:MAG: hypothetical protein HUJ68_09455 [Clostridia bacterium]|nr:hypothetical protein [Clostridia bacterium]